MKAVDAQGLEVRIAPAAQGPAQADSADGEALSFGLVGRDRPGIVHQVTAALSALGVNIEAFDTKISAGAETGAPLFNAEARLRLPAGLDAQTVREALEAISGEIMVDISLEPVSLT